MIYALFALGAITGALCRYHLVRIVQTRQRGIFPVGTLLVNTSGSLLLGLIASLAANDPNWQHTTLQLVAGAGFCATYTTFSSFMFESVQLWRRHYQRVALLNLCAQPLLGLGCAWLGLLVGSGVTAWLTTA
jgi:CrcB protein